MPSQQTVAQGWVADIVDVYIDRFDTSAGTPVIKSTTRICKCESGADTDCTIDSTQVTGLDPFIQADDASLSSDFKHYQACGIHGSEAQSDVGTSGVTLGVKLGADKFKHQFGLMPLAAASADLFKIRYEVILTNSKAGSSTRRRLRSSKMIRLKAGEAGASGSSNGLSVIALDEEGDHDHTGDGAHDHPISGGAIAGIVIGVVALLAILAFIGYKLMSRKSDSDEEAVPFVQEDSGEELRSSRFRNLRY